MILNNQIDLLMNILDPFKAFRTTLNHSLSAFERKCQMTTENVNWSKEETVLEWLGLTFLVWHVSLLIHSIEISFVTQLTIHKELDWQVIQYIV